MINGIPFIFVDSAYGGLAFYSSYILKENRCKYSAPDNDCEHVAFNTCLKNYVGAKLAVIPRLIIPWGGCIGKLNKQHQKTTNVIERGY